MVYVIVVSIWVCFLSLMQWYIWLTGDSTMTMQDNNIKPLGDGVVLKVKGAKEKTKGVILLYTIAETNLQGGEVVTVGEEKSIGNSKVEV